MSNAYFRLSDTWTKLLDPREDATFFYNTSGTTALFYFSNVDITPTSDNVHPFPVGGSISQLQAPSDKFIFAKALIDGESEIVVSSSSSKITSELQESLQEDLSATILEVMKINQRLFDEEVRSIKRNEMQLWFIREYYMQNQKFHTDLSTLYCGQFDLLNRMLGVEVYIYDHGKEFASLANKLNSIDASLFDSVTFSAMQTNIGQMSASISSINSLLDDLVPRVESAWGDYDSLVKTEIAPMQEDLSLLSAQFLSLHNAIVKLGTQYDANVLNQVFNVFVASVDAEMTPAVTALRDMVLRIIGNETNITDLRTDVDTNTESLSTKVDYEDKLFIEPGEILTVLEVDA